MKYTVTIAYYTLLHHIYAVYTTLNFQIYIINKLQLQLF